jgi:hypothetical protein
MADLCSGVIPITLGRYPGKKSGVKRERKWSLFDGLRPIRINGAHCYAEGKLDRVPDLSGALVRLNVDRHRCRRLHRISSGQKCDEVHPIVMAHGSDPVALKYVVNLARSGGNITGLTHLAPELGGKRLSCSKDIIAGRGNWRAWAGL